MSRMLLPNGRLLQLTFDEAKTAYVVRILQGGVYLTPKLTLTLKHLYELLCQHPVQLGEWLILTHDSKTLDVQFKKEPAVACKWTEFYNLAKIGRDDPLAEFDVLREGSYHLDKQS